MFLFPNGNLKIYHCVYKATRYTRKKNGKDKRTFVREGLRAFGHIPTIHYMILQGPLYCHLIKVSTVHSRYKLFFIEVTKNCHPNPENTENNYEAKGVQDFSLFSIVSLLLSFYFFIFVGKYVH